MHRTTLKLGKKIVIVTHIGLDYKQVRLTDLEHRTLQWADTDRNAETFRYEIVSYNKKGEPEYRSVVVNSTIKLVLNEQKYHSLREYENVKAALHL